MPHDAKTLDIRFGGFACSIRGYDDPARVLRQVVRAVQDMAEEHPGMTGLSVELSADTLDEVMTRLRTGADAIAIGAEAVPCLMVIREGTAAVAEAAADSVADTAAEDASPEHAPASGADASGTGSSESGIIVLGGPVAAAVEAPPAETGEAPSELPVATPDPAPAEAAPAIAAEADASTETPLPPEGDLVEPELVEWPEDEAAADDSASDALDPEIETEPEAEPIAEAEPENVTAAAGAEGEELPRDTPDAAGEPQDDTSASSADDAEPIEPEVIAPEAIEPEAVEPEAVEPGPVEPEIAAAEAEIAEDAPEGEPDAKAAIAAFLESGPGSDAQTTLPDGTPAPTEPETANWEDVPVHDLLLRQARDPAAAPAPAQTARERTQARSNSFGNADAEQDSSSFLSRALSRMIGTDAKPSFDAGSEDAGDDATADEKAADLSADWHTEAELAPEPASEGSESEDPGSEDLAAEDAGAQDLETEPSTGTPHPDAEPKPAAAASSFNLFVDDADAAPGDERHGTVSIGASLGEDLPQADEPAANFQARANRFGSSGGLGSPGQTPPAGSGTGANGTEAAAFSREWGAETVPELLAAAAAYLTIRKSRTRFSRREVMDVFDQMPGDQPRSLESRIKGFGRLVREGTLVLVEDGVFAMSQSARARYEP